MPSTNIYVKNEDVGAPTGNTSFEESVIAAAPQWYWKLDETTGLVATDTMGNNDITYNVNANTATYTVASSTADGEGYAKDAGNTTKYIEANDSSTTGHLQGSSDFTIEIAFSIGIANSNMRLLSLWNNSVEAQKQWTIGLSSDTNILRLGLREADQTSRSTDACSDLSAAGVTANGAWHYLSIRMDYTGTALLTVQIDGVEVASTDVSGWAGTLASTSMMTYPSPSLVGISSSS